MDLLEIESVLNLLEIEILNIYVFGSQVYNYKKSEDIDLIIVTKDNIKIESQKFNQYDLQFYSKEYFQELLDKQNIKAIECFFLPSKFKIKENYLFNYNINPIKLREESSKISSNSFVKAKKKLEVIKDFNPLIAKKSLFHSLRILDFTIDLLINKKISNYEVANQYWNDIDKLDNWVLLKEKFQSVYNEKKQL